MSAQDTTLSQTISDKLKSRTDELLSEYPDATQWLDTYTEQKSTSTSQRTTVAQQVSNTLSTEKTAAEYLQQVSQEEFLTVMNKLGQLMQSGLENAGDAKLYLEQQLSDLLGFTVASELQGHILPHSVGTMTAGKHLKRHPQDTLTEHLHHLEAGISEHRSAFGWFAQIEPLSDESVALEQYWIGIALSSLPGWGSNRQQLAHWWKHRKVLVVNPVAHTFVIAIVADSVVSTIQTQLVGSPELMRVSSCWSPGSAGKVLLYFIDDSQDNIPVGPIFMSPQAPDA